MSIGKLLTVLLFVVFSNYGVFGQSNLVGTGRVFDNDSNALISVSVNYNSQNFNTNKEELID
jgi:hypothetical protein